MFLKYKQQSLKKITAIALAVLFLDQILKFMIVRNIFFEIEVYKNYNALFGLPINFNLVFIFFIFLIFVSYFIFPPFKKGAGGILFSIAPGLILGGIIGNLTDRFFYGYIIVAAGLFTMMIMHGTFTTFGVFLALSMSRVC